MEKYVIETQLDLTNRTRNNDPDTSIAVMWEYPTNPMRCHTEKIIGSGWSYGEDGCTFEMTIQNPLEDENVQNMLRPCLEWMKEHGADTDESIKWKFYDLLKHANYK